MWNSLQISTYMSVYWQYVYTHLYLPTQYACVVHGIYVYSIYGIHDIYVYIKCMLIYMHVYEYLLYNPILKTVYNIHVYIDWKYLHQNLNCITLWLVEMWRTYLCFEYIILIIEYVTIYILNILESITFGENKRVEEKAHGTRWGSTANTSLRPDQGCLLL